MIEYPGRDALEILDKPNVRTELLQSARADRVRGDFKKFVTNDHNEDEFDEFDNPYEAILAQSVSRH